MGGGPNLSICACVCVRVCVGLCAYLCLCAGVAVVVGVSVSVFSRAVVCLHCAQLVGFVVFRCVLLVATINLRLLI